MCGCGVTPGRHDALAQGDVVGETVTGVPCSTMGGDMAGFVDGPLVFGLLGGFFGDFTTLGCGVGWPIAPLT